MDTKILRIFPLSGCEQYIISLLEESAAPYLTARCYCRFYCEACDGSLTGPGIKRFAIETLTEDTGFTPPLSVALFLYDKVPKDMSCSSKLREGICTFRFSV